MEIVSEDSISEIVQEFKCLKDNDIQSFLHDKAALFNRKGKSKTHLILNQESLALVSQLA